MVSSVINVDDSPAEKLIGLPITVFDQLLNGVAEGEEELVLDDPPLPAHAIKIPGKAKMIIFFMGILLRLNQLHSN